VGNPECGRYKRRRRVATLTMVLRSANGVVLGADAPYGTTEGDGPIRALSPRVAVVIHDDWRFGSQLLDGFLAGSPDLGAPVELVTTSAAASFSAQCEEVARQGPLPLVGFLMAGVSRDSTPSTEIFGLFVGNRFEPRPFSGNLFGGGNNEVARLLDMKLRGPMGPERHMLARAALYFVETRSVPALRLDPETTLAVFTADGGLQVLAGDEVVCLLDLAALASERVLVNAPAAFYGD
jgi:hypothetical protein